MPSLEGILSKLQQEGFEGNDLGKWLSLGSRWARVAGAASVYFLILIASKHQTYRIGSEISSTVLAEVCHEIRAPSRENLALVRDGIIPSVRRLQNALSFSIPVLFSAQLRNIYRLPSTLNIADVEATDWFFDLFYQRMVVNVPRDRTLWEKVLEYKASSGKISGFYSFNQRYLNSSCAGKQWVGAWDETGPLSEEEMEDAIGSEPLPDRLPPPKTIAFFGDILEIPSPRWGTLYILKSSFNSKEALKASLPYTTGNRNRWTEDQRQFVQKGERPETLKTFAEKLQQGYNTAGKVKAKQKWLILTQEALAGREVKIVDAEDKTIVTVDATLPEENRKCLENAITALCRATSVEILDLNTSKLPANRQFKVWHLSYYARYGQSGKDIPPDFHPLHIQRADGSKVNHCQFFVRASKDLQIFGREFAALSEAIVTLSERT
ncbi:hypothetical protein EV361DRAFT_956715 [Lentinula raphanica]|nr:hypothetical protein EV361DRAFT_956715 [Lentinula raphanica]